MRYFLQHVLLCITGVHEQLADFRDIYPLDTNIPNLLKKDQTHRFFVLCLKLEYFFKL